MKDGVRKHYYYQIKGLLISHHYHYDNNARCGSCFCNMCYHGFDSNGEKTENNKYILLHSVKITHS